MVKILDDNDIFLDILHMVNNIVVAIVIDLRNSNSLAIVVAAFVFVFAFVPRTTISIVEDIANEIDLLVDNLCKDVDYNTSNFVFLHVDTNLTIHFLDDVVVAAFAFVFVFVPRTTKTIDWNEDNNDIFEDIHLIVIDMVLNIVLAFRF